MTATILHTVIILLALVGNILVIYVLNKKPETRGRLTSFMYVNLAVADLLVTVLVMPLSMQSILMDGRWFDGGFGLFLAKLIMFLFFVALTASIFSLTVIAFDVFFHIVRPLQTFPRFRNKKTLIPIVWISSMCLMTPWLVIVKVKDSRIEYQFTQFGELQASLRGVYLYLVVTIYVFPLVTVCILYGHVCQKLRSHTLPGVAINNRATHRVIATKRQVIRMSITLAVAFALCWLPAHVYHVILAIDVEIHQSLPRYVMLVCYWCGHANSAVNPWLLVYFKKRFRAVFRKMITYPLSRMSFTSKANGSVRRPASKRIVPATEVYQFTSTV